MRQLKINKSITNRSSAALDKYLVEIGREELISTDEEVELAQRIHKGDREALEKLTRANLRFVVSVAKQYQNQGLALNDIINEGNVGLIKAAKSLTKRAASSSSAMPYGGFVRAYCRPYRSRAALCACRSTRWVFRAR